MSKFITELCLIEIGDKLWKLHKPLVYESGLLTYTVTDARGKSWDTSSMPPTLAESDLKG